MAPAQVAPAQVAPLHLTAVPVGAVGRRRRPSRRRRRGHGLSLGLPHAAVRVPRAAADRPAASGWPGPARRRGRGRRRPARRRTPTVPRLRAERRSTSRTWSGRELRTLRQHQRRGAGDDGRRLRGAAALEEPRADRAGSPCVWSMNEPGARRLTSETPGATRSGPRLPLAALPRLEKAGDGVVVAVASCPGCPRRRPRARPGRRGAGSPPSAVPPLPADTTTTMPLSQATSAACASGSSR